MKNIFAGNTQLNVENQKVDGRLIDFEGEKYYKIENYDSMPPFFMTITSDSDHWMFLSSNGGLTCGRKDRENSLFPYYTDDKIHDSNDTTGPVSILFVKKEGKDFLWQPFTNNYQGAYKLKRNIYKNVLGNKVVFEEQNETLGITFCYAWKNSDKFGFVKESWVINKSGQSVTIEVVDGLRNILPYGVNTGLQTNMSTLVDGYKKCELIEDSSLGIYTLSSILTDKAEPSEALKASVVWSKGLDVKHFLLSEVQLEEFTKGHDINTEKVIKGRRGAYFVNSEFALEPEAKKSWIIVAEVSQNQSQVVKLISHLKYTSGILNQVSSDIQESTENLSKLIVNADGFQTSADELSAYRHLSNTMFNIMRGGIYFDDYHIPDNDFREYVQVINAIVADRHKQMLNQLPNAITYSELLTKVNSTNDADLVRITMEYLPLTFSRRHGDPSRPWNFFQIDVKKEDGSKKLNYQGNWRDIFQNWEALSYSFPHFIEGIIAKFVNASTVDGYNPYRVTKNGIDWEILDPEDPWSNIGYWGDHQIIYLQKLLELSDKFHAGKLAELLSEKVFVYANVPYRIKKYNDIVKNPYDTIEYDDNIEKIVGERVKQFGSDGKLVFGTNNEPYKSNLAEKLLVPLFAKLSNFVPNGGIWLNTQRPEWNDANNALVGYGLSMVTVYYMRRYISFIKNLFAKSGKPVFEISAEVISFFKELDSIFSQNKHFTGIVNSGKRLEIVDKLGDAGTQYRNSVYQNGFSGKTNALESTDLVAFLDTVLLFIDGTIASNKKQNGLYHAYNLIELAQSGIEIHYLTDMLEGQVALLSSGFLKPEEAVEVLDALRNSGMYRADQNSYTLYPDKELPAFLAKNIVPMDKVNSSKYLVAQLNSGNKSIIEKDINGQVHFNGIIRNANQLREMLMEANDIDSSEIDIVCNIYFEVFNHREFTGRSGTFFKYEGLGSIYWHMVSKLLLAVQENFYAAIDNGAHAETIEKLGAHYYQVRAGLGVTKNPAEYGAFPIDPYSHTPGFAGVQQPGMTGQVKEDFISRFGELGVIIKEGVILFNPVLLRKSEFIIAGSLGHLKFTYCGIPIEYRLADANSIIINSESGTQTIKGLTLNSDNSADIFSRNGKVQSITVSFDRKIVIRP